MQALILVDLQNDFCPGGALAVPEGDQVIYPANRLLESQLFPLVVATQDWHPPNHQSFAVNHPGRAVGDTVDLYGVDQILWPAHCVQETPGSRIVSELRVDLIDQSFQKGVDEQIDSYSTFFDNARRRSTGLYGFLHRRRVNAIYVLGLATDYCVKYSTLDAIQLGFTTQVVTDACRGIDLEDGDMERAFQEMRRAGAGFVRSTDLLEHGLAANVGTDSKAVKNFP